ncbi:MAG TPA: ABC transporter ATP-binding protein [Bacillales bacterium]|nr:ABC transporter ATP-binding protein [Bacillales bacterium]
MSKLNTQRLAISYDKKIVVEDLNLEIPEGKITALVGSNGSGKSTILKCLVRILSPKQGAVYLNGQSIHQQSTKDVAKQMAILPQNPISPPGITVSELISFGRFPYQRGLGRLTSEDYKIIKWAIDVTGLKEFKDHSVDKLSGGQRQRAWIAMALAQGTDLLLLDEPTTFLDIAHQLEILKLLQSLNHEVKRTIVMVVHDLNHATRFAHHMVVIKKGKVVDEGTPTDVMTKDMLREVFNIDADIIPDPRTNLPLCIPQNISGQGETVPVNTLLKII